MLQTRAGFWLSHTCPNDRCVFIFLYIKQIHGRYLPAYLFKPTTFSCCVVWSLKMIHYRIPTIKFERGDVWNQFRNSGMCRIYHKSFPVDLIDSIRTDAALKNEEHIWNVSIVKLSFHSPKICLYTQVCLLIIHFSVTSTDESKPNLFILFWFSNPVLFGKGSQIACPRFIRDSLHVCGRIGYHRAMTCNLNINWKLIVVFLQVCVYSI